MFLCLTLGYEFLHNQTTWVDVTIEGFTTTSPSIASSTTTQTALSESSLDPKELIYPQTTIDDSQNQALTDSPFMFSTSMAPSSSSESPSSQYVAITEDLEVDDSVTTHTDIRNVSETQDYRVHLVSATAGPAVPETPSEKSEDEKVDEIGTIPSDVLIPASSSTESMFALGKTEESILETEKIDTTSDLMHTTPDLTVEPTKLISMPVEVSQSSRAKDDTILPNITNVHLTTMTEMSPTEEIQSTAFADYDINEKVTDIGVMAGPPPIQSISEVSDTTDGLSTMPGTSDATITFPTHTVQPSTAHSDVTTSASSTVAIPMRLTTPVPSEILTEKSDSTMSTGEESVSYTPEVLGEGGTKGEDIEDIPSVTLSEKSTRNCTDIAPVQVIIINVHEPNKTGKALLIFLFIIPMKIFNLLVRALTFFEILSTLHTLTSLRFAFSGSYVFITQIRLIFSHD